MSPISVRGHPGGSGRHQGADLIPKDYLRAIAVWSLVPSYMLAGGFFGWLLDRWVGWFPALTCLGLLLALALSVRDMLRLKDQW